VGSVVGGDIAVSHNYLILVDPNLIQTSQGIQNPQVNQLANRIGDVIHCITSTLFVHLTGNNLMDYINKRRYKIISRPRA